MPKTHPPILTLRFLLNNHEYKPAADPRRLRKPSERPRMKSAQGAGRNTGYARSASLFLPGGPLRKFVYGLSKKPL